MTMARYQFMVTDEAGNIIPEAHIEVRREQPGQPLAALKSNRAGTTPLANPFDADSEGFAYFHVSGGAFQIRAYTGPSGAPTFERIWSYVAIGLAAETDAVVSTDFDTKADVEAADVNLDENYLRIAGHTAVGDGGAALYVRVVSEPSHEGKIQSNDEAWWELSEQTVNPEMFGAVGDGTTDDQPAVQAMHDFCEARAADGYGHTMVLGRRIYAIASTWNLRPTAVFNLRLQGQGSVFGSRLLTKTSFSGSAAVKISTGSLSGFTSTTDFVISGFTVVGGVNTTAVAGIQIGEAGAAINGLHESKIEDVCVVGSSGAGGLTTGWSILNARLIKYDRCSAWMENIQSAIGVMITVGSTSGNFTGDLDFYNLQVVVSPDLGALGSKCVVLRNSQAADVGIAGVRFHSPILYHADRFIEITSNLGNIQDIWIDKPQCDGVSGVLGVIWVEAGGADAVIADLHITNGYTQGTLSGVTLYQHDGGKVESVDVSGWWFSGVSGQPLAVTGATGVRFTNNTVRDASLGTAGVIFANNCSGLIIDNLTLEGSMTCNYVLDVRGTSDYVMIGDVSTNGTSLVSLVLNSSSGTHHNFRQSSSSAVGFAARASSGLETRRSLTAPAAGLTISNNDGAAGAPTFALANDLAAVEALGSTGIAVRIATDTWAQRTITGTANEIDVANGSGVGGNPTLSLPASIKGAWTSFTPVLTASSGTMTTTSATCFYVQIGKLVIATFEFSLTNIGTGGGTLNITMPVSPKQTRRHSMAGQLATSGFGINGIYDNTGGSLNFLSVRKYDGTTIIVNGAIGDFTMVYEAN